MSTRIRTRNLVANIPEAYPQASAGYEEMDTTTAGGSFATLGQLGAEGNPYPTEKTMVEDSTYPNFAFWSERVAAEVTISGAITFNIFRTHLSSFTAWMRVRLYKVTTGGVETLILQTDAPQTNGSNSALNFSATPPTAVTVGPGERFLLRISWNPITPGSWGTGTPNVLYGAASGTGFTYLDFTETFTTQPNATVLHMRRTNVAGIGNFLDALPAAGSSALTTGIVNTVASGTEVQWTRTAGGTPLEFITPRLKHPGWTMETSVAKYISNGAVFAAESNLAANCALRMKLFRRTPSGAETLFYTLSRGTELGTTRVSQGLTTGTIDATIPFYEDDRLVIRFYIINIGTMASGFTCDLAYDGNAITIGLDGVAAIQVVSFPFLKAEGDPAGPSRATDMSMTGLGG